MTLIISKNKMIRDVQQDFSSRYPFLKLEFYKPYYNDPLLPVRKHLAHSTLLAAAGLKDNGEIELRDDMTVADLENTFLEQFGLNVQVSRKSGLFWLETTMTDKWSLQKQNEHGREISMVGEKLPRTGSGEL